MINHHFDDYDLSTNDDRRAVKDLLNLKFNQRCKSVENQGGQYIYDEQSKYASDILSAFKRNIHLSTFVAPVQWGKTGVIISLIHKCCMDDDIFINPNNILIITGMSDNEWKKQTKDRLINELQTSVHHLHGIINMSFDNDFKLNLKSNLVLSFLNIFFIKKFLNAGCSIDFLSLLSISFLVFKELKSKLSNEFIID